MSDVDDSAGSGGSSSGSTSGGPDGSPVYNADAEAIIEAIERAKQVPDEMADKIGRFEATALPSFGEPDENCGDPIPESIYFCPNCASVHEKPHVCKRYDCPQHWAHAIRRRAAGSADGAGLAPKLDALRRWLFSCDGSGDDWYYHHVTISLGKDRRLAAEKPLQRDRETIREIMDELGIQGLVAFHPWAGDNEDHSDDDIGKWKDRIGEDTDWDAVRDDLEYRPHWHIIGVAPHVDVSVTPAVQEATGAVIHRIEDDDGKSISRREDEETDDNAMVRALTYTLSHAAIYETESGQRRLAAWMKGPDVHRVTPLERNKQRMKAIVNAECKDTLGIAPADMDCDETLDVQDDRDDVAEASARSRRSPIEKVWNREPTDLEETVGAKVDGGSILSGPPEPSSPSRAGELPSKRSGELPNTAPEARGQLRSGGEGIGARSSSRTTASASTRSESPAPADDRDDAVDDEPDEEPDEQPTSDAEPDECGTHLRHISAAGDFLLDEDWNEEHDAKAIRDVETAYKSYVTYMTRHGRDPVEDRTTIPEFAGDDDLDEPPPD